MDIADYFTNLDSIEAIDKANEKLDDVLANDIKLADFYSRIVIDAANSHKYHRIVIEATRALGSSLRYQGQYDASKDQLLKAISLAEEFGFHDLFFKAKIQLHDVVSLTGDIETAASLLKEVLISDTAYKDPQIMEKATTSMGVLLTRKGEFLEAIEYFERSKTLSQNSGNSHNLSEASRNIGNAMTLLGNLTGGIVLLIESLNIARSLNNKILISYCLYVLCYAYLQMGELKSSREMLEEYCSINSLTGSKFDSDVSLVLENELLRLEGKPLLVLENLLPLLSTIIPNKERKIQITQIIAECFFDLNDDSRAIEYFNLAYNDICEYKYNHGFINILECIAKVYRRMGKFEMALQKFEEIKRIEQEQDHFAAKAKLTTLHVLLSIEREQHLREFVELKLQQSETDLANKAILIASQSELLGNFRNDLRQIVREINEPIEALKKIKEKLKTLPCEQIDWMKFEGQFTSVHPEFKAKLTEKFPELTPQETRVCLLLRVGMKSYEIGRIICVSERGVENHRFNIRKKLGLKTEQPLTEFLQSIK